MGRGKIEYETKREKMDFCLGGTQEEGESKVLPPSRRHKERVCKSKERRSRTIKKKRERESSNEDRRTRELRESPRGSCLEKKNIAKRESCAWKRK